MGSRRNQNRNRYSSSTLRRSNNNRYDSYYGGGTTVIDDIADNIQAGIDDIVDYAHEQEESIMEQSEQISYLESRLLYNNHRGGGRRRYNGASRNRRHSRYCNDDYED